MKSLAGAIQLGLILLGIPAHGLNGGLGEPPESVDRETPLSSIQGFLREAHAGHYAVAAHYLWLNHLPKAAQPQYGARLARRLRFVIDRRLELDYDRISRDPEGRYETVGVLQIDRTRQPIRLARVELGGEKHAWVFSEDTVRAVDRLYELYAPPLGEVLPEFLFRHAVFDLELWQCLGLLVVILAATLLAIPLQRLGLWIGSRAATHTAPTWSALVIKALRGPLRLLLWALLISIGTRTLLFPSRPQQAFDRLATSLAILAGGWLLLRLLHLGAGSVHDWATSGSQDPARIRGLKTQIALLKRVLEVAVYLISGALLLLQFQVVRNLGVSLLASAGIAGLVLGLAAQRSIGMLLAGIQLSITQPIRIGDMVVVERETGTIEEINLTYVVVKIWDLRRQIVPMTYFLEKPFQNWSKGGSQILGTVNLQVDFGADIDALRAELRRILDSEGRRLWDGKVENIAVTDASDKTANVRVLVSSADPDANFDLCCLIRERLLSLMAKHPQWLPTVRSEQKGRAETRAT